MNLFDKSGIREVPVPNVIDNGYHVNSNNTGYEVVGLEPRPSDIYAIGNWSTANASTGDSDLDIYPDSSSQLLSDILGIWITGIFCLLGFAGNILSVVVLLRAHARSPMFLVLRAVAISDAAFLFCVFIMQTVVNIYPHWGTLESCFTYRGYIQAS